MYSITHHTFCAVYGPVRSWQYGLSLGIDPIGAVSTCSFDCIYCQLGEIQQKTCDRQLFLPTLRILEELHAFAPWDVDVITLSGSGEPTLALNLGEIISITQTLTEKPVGVLTNGSLLIQPEVQEELAIADQVAVKLDAVAISTFQRVNHPVAGVQFADIWQGLQQFRQRYSGHLAIQTMMLAPWTTADQDDYIARMQELRPDEIQLNTPAPVRLSGLRLELRSKAEGRPLSHQLEAQGNSMSAQLCRDHKDRPDPSHSLKPISAETLAAFGDRVHQSTQIPVRSALGVTS